MRLWKGKFAKALKAGWQHYKNIKAMGSYPLVIQRKETIKRMGWINYVSENTRLELDSVCDLYDFATENGISKEEIIRFELLTGMDAKHLIIALTWLAYIAEHSPLSVSAMIAYDLYGFAQRERHSKEDIVSIACKIGSDPKNIIRLLNEGDIECIIKRKKSL